MAQQPKRLQRKLSRSRRATPGRTLAKPAEQTRAGLAEVLGYPVQAKLKVGSPDDAHEREADAVAARVLAAPEGTLQRADDEEKKAATEREPERDEEVQRQPVSHQTAADLDATLPGGGQGLPAAERGFFEPRLGADLAGVRIHADAPAAALADRLAARAFTAGRDVYFAAGEYRPGTREGRHLLAHELTHVLQQRGGAGQVQRKLELRPPGKGEASAFGRAKELVDRLNKVSPAIQYTLTGQVLSYTVKDVKALGHFDKRMMAFIDQAAVVPMRLITHKGLVGGSNLFADSFVHGYVDLDDLMADDLYSFQSDLLHFLTERFQVKGYERKIGTALGPEFPKAHKAGKDAEAEQLRALFKDPSIVFVYEELKPNNTWINAFKSKTHGYWVFQVVKRADKAIAGGEMWVKRKDGTRVSMDDFRKERAAAP